MAEREFREAVNRAVRDAQAYVRVHGPVQLLKGRGIGGGDALAYDAINLASDTHNDWWQHAYGRTDAERNRHVNAALRLVHRTLEGGRRNLGVQGRSRVTMTMTRKALSSRIHEAAAAEGVRAEFHTRNNQMSVEIVTPSGMRSRPMSPGEAARYFGLTGFGTGQPRRGRSRVTAVRTGSPSWIRNAKYADLLPGDPVMVKNPRSRDYQGFGIVRTVGRAWHRDRGHPALR